MWWTPDKGMLQLHGQLPDVMGATFEATIQKLTEQMKPAKGQAWDSFEHRAADALVSLCEQPATAGRDADVGVRGRWCRCTCPRTARRRSPGSRSPTRCSSSCGPTRASNRCWSTTTASRSAIGKRISATCHRRSCGRCCCATGTAAAPTPATSPGASRSITCAPGPGVATDDPSNLIAIARGHHPRLIPHGPWALVGNPNLPDGIDRVHLDDLSPEQREQLGLPPPRAGPTP